VDDPTRLVSAIAITPVIGLSILGLGLRLTTLRGLVHPVGNFLRRSFLGRSSALIRLLLGRKLRPQLASEGP